MLEFSLVTTCRNEAASFDRWRRDVLNQTRAPVDIVIVDAFSDDGTAEMLIDWQKQDERVVVIQERGNAAHGRNLAIERARFEHILSTDMGVRLSPVWCAELIAPFEKNSEVEIVAGSTRIDEETVSSSAARAEYYVARGGEPRLEAGFVPGNRSVAYMKRVWRELDGLPEDLTFYADDSVFGRQMIQRGYRMSYAPKAMTYWQRPQRLRDFYREQANYGRGDGEASIKTPFAFRAYQKGYCSKRLVPFLTGFRTLQKQLHFASVVRALRAMDFAALALMPVLLFGCGYSFGKGYLDGDEHGRQFCRACRSRLRRPDPTLSVTE